MLPTRRAPVAALLAVAAATLLTACSGSTGISADGASNYWVCSGRALT